MTSRTNLNQHRVAIETMRGQRAGAFPQRNFPGSRNASATIQQMARQRASAPPMPRTIDSGEVVGPGGGTDDMVRGVAVSPNSFTVPHDVVRAYGNGSHKVGVARLDQVVAKTGGASAAGPKVRVNLSNGEYQLPEGAVKAAGRGDFRRGVDRLSAWVLAHHRPARSGPDGRANGGPSSDAWSQEYAQGGALSADQHAAPAVAGTPPPTDGNRTSGGNDRGSPPADPWQESYQHGAFAGSSATGPDSPSGQFSFANGGSPAAIDDQVQRTQAPTPTPGYFSGATAAAAGPISTYGNTAGSAAATPATPSDPANPMQGPVGRVISGALGLDSSAPAAGSTTPAPKSDPASPLQGPVGQALVSGYNASPGRANDFRLPDALPGHALLSGVFGNTAEDTPGPIASYGTTRVDTTPPPGTGGTADIGIATSPAGSRSAPGTAGSPLSAGASFQAPVNNSGQPWRATPAAGNDGRLGGQPPAPYGAGDFAFRNMLATNKTTPVAPGAARVVNYGPAYGDTPIIAAADANGRFNSFSGTGTPGAAPAGGMTTEQANTVYGAMNRALGNQLVMQQSNIARGLPMNNGVDVGAVDRATEVGNIADRSALTQQQLQGGQIDLQQKRQMAQYAATLGDPNATPAQRANASRAILVAHGKNPDEWKLQHLAGGEVDSPSGLPGSKLRLPDAALLYNEAGQHELVTLGAPTQNLGGYSSVAEAQSAARAAVASGKISQADANKRLASVGIPAI